MFSPTTGSEFDEKFITQKSFPDLEANIVLDNDPALIPSHTPSPTSSRQPNFIFLLQKFISYPSSNSLGIRPTSWLDGIRGVAALEVYIFHATGPWAALVPAYHASPADTNVLQLPLLRTFFVSGGTAVSLFFALSGYVLTHKSLHHIRNSCPQLVYPSVGSSLFRRGFRLYLPPVLLTFAEMLATRFGYAPALNFSFVPESSFWGQLLDWVVETNRFVNPWYNFWPAVCGSLVHPKYDTVIWTIPLEFYGSLVSYSLLFTLAKVAHTRIRMGFVAWFAVSCMCLGSWSLSCFAAGMWIADFNLGQDESPSSGSKHGRLWMVVLALALYVAGHPTMSTEEAMTNPMPGFSTLRSLTPLPLQDPARFWWSLSGLSILFSISQLPSLKHIFETPLCQYLGRISFSLYLIHEFCLVLFGLAVKEVLLRLAGLDPGVKGESVLYWVCCTVWFVLFTLPVFALAAQVERWVDAPSVRFARALEGRCLKICKIIR